MPSATDHLGWAIQHLNQAVEHARMERQVHEFTPLGHAGRADRRRLQRLSERVGALIAVTTLATELMPSSEEPDAAC